MNKRKMKEMMIKAKEGSLNLKGELEKTFKVQDARDKKIFYSVLGVILLILIYVIFIRGYFSGQEKKRIAEEKAKMEAIKQERIVKVEQAPKSRISFFLANPVRANLAIPDYWEGNYRLSESKNKASFVYVEDPSKTAEIFYIRMVKVGELSELLEGEKEIGENKRVSKGEDVYAFVYKMSEESPYPDNEMLRGRFDRMRIDANEIIKKYFKIF